MDHKGENTRKNERQSKRRCTTAMSRKKGKYPHANKEGKIETRIKKKTAADAPQTAIDCIQR